MVEDVKSPLPGKILSIKVKPGDRVNVNDVLLTIESMKMENEVLAPKAGVVKEVKVSSGTRVSVGTSLVVIE